MASAVASTFLAVSTWRFSMSRPLSVTTPLPSAWAVSKAAMTARASLDLVALGREDLVARLDLARVDQRLAVEAHLPALVRLGEEALGVLDVVEDPVDDGHPGGPRREDRELERGLDRRPARARTSPRAPCRGRWSRARGRRAGRTPRAISSACSTATGVSTIAQSRVCSGAPGGLHGRDQSDAPRRPSSTLGTTIASGPAAAAAARSASCHCVPSPLTRIVSSRLPYSPDCTAAQAFSRAASFASGATASSRSRMSASTGRVFAFSSARSLELGM